MWHESGFTPPLVFCFLVSWLASYLVSRNVVNRGTSFLLSFFKVAIPLFFFAIFNHGQWYMLDDLAYLDYTLYMYKRGYTPFNSIFPIGGRDPISSVVGSGHTLYYWYNLVAFNIFGVHYYSAVFMNVVLTFVASFVMYKLLLTLDFTKKYATGYFIFFVLHWDIIAWSTFVNLKDIVVVTLSCSAFFCLFRFIKTFKFLPLLGLLVTCTFLTCIRHYIPPILFLSAAIWGGLEWNDRRKYWLILIVALVMLILQPWNTQYVDYFVIKNPINVLYNAIKFALMPQFWTVRDPDELFVEIPSFLHWVLFLPMFYGAFRLWKDVKLLRLWMIYFMIMVCFYAVVPELQGPRQRLQLVPLIALAQFHLFWLLISPGKHLLPSEEHEPED